MRERAQAGLKVARARGRKGGRPKKRGFQKKRKPRRWLQRRSVEKES